MSMVRIDESVNCDVEIGKAYRLLFTDVFECKRCGEVLEVGEVWKSLFALMQGAFPLVVVLSIVFSKSFLIGGFVSVVVAVLQAILLVLLLNRINRNVCLKAGFIP